MKREKTQFALVVLVAVGMVGIYVGAWMAYQKYQEYKANVSSGKSVGGLFSLLTAATGS